MKASSGEVGSVGLVRLLDLATQINAEHDAAGAAMSSALSHAVNAGRLLIEAKGTVDHGEWADWLSDNVTFTDRTARRYVQLATQLPELEAISGHAVSDLPVREALKLLAKPKATAKTPRAPKETPPESETESSEESFSVCPHCGYEAGESSEPFDAQLVIGRVMFVVVDATANWPKNVSMDELINELQARIDILKRKKTAA